MQERDRAQLSALWPWQSQKVGRACVLMQACLTAFVAANKEQFVAAGNTLRTAGQNPPVEPRRLRSELLITHVDFQSRFGVDGHRVGSEASDIERCDE